MKTRILIALAAGLLIAGLQSCSSSSSPSGTDNSYTPKTVKFKQGFSATYDLFLTDTTSSDPILQDSAQHNVVETVLDTNRFYGGFTHVTSTYFASSPGDSNYYYQDAQGNLWRYNYGFSRLNSYSFLVAALGGPVDVHWVLVAKPGSPVGTTWVAKNDSAIFQALGNAKIYLKDVATTMADSTFTIGGQSVPTTHVQHIVTATDASGVAFKGSISIDTYISTELGITVEDFFHHSTIASPTYNAKARGSLKIMTSHQ